MLTIKQDTKPSEIYLTLMNDFRGLPEAKRAEVVATLEVFAADYRKGFFGVTAAAAASLKSTIVPQATVVVGPCPGCEKPATLDPDFGLCSACARERAEREALANTGGHA